MIIPNICAVGEILAQKRIPQEVLLYLNGLNIYQNDAPKGLALQMEQEMK